MKKLSFFSALAMLLTSLTGCNNVHIEHNLIFSELCIGSAIVNRAVEIYNVSEKEIDLKDYQIAIYRDLYKDARPTDIIQLDGVLQGFSTYVVGYIEANSEIKSRSNQISPKLMTDGSFPMTITYKNDYVIDTLGYAGFSTNIAEHTDLVRKTDELFHQEQFNPSSFIRYPVDTFTNLGNVNGVTNAEIFEGPRLSEENFNTPFATNATKGTGGVMEVKVVSYIDGDTTKLNFGNKFAQYGISGTMSLRYYGVNTPEIAHYPNPADPYGNEARDYTNSVLKRAKKFLVQSITNYSLTETYGRALGYLWVAFVDNPKPEDYICMSHHIIQQGYSNPSFVDRLNLCNYMLYKGISYTELLFDANNYAKENKLNIHTIVY